MSSDINMICNRFLTKHYPDLVWATSKERAFYFAGETRNIFEIYERHAEDASTDIIPVDKFKQFMSSDFPNVSRATRNNVMAALFGYENTLYNTEHNSQNVSLYSIANLGHYFRVVNESRGFISDTDTANGILTFSGDHDGLILLNTIANQASHQTISLMDVEAEFDIHSNLFIADELGGGLSIEYDIPEEIGISEDDLIGINRKIQSESMSPFFNIVSRHLDTYMASDIQTPFLSLTDRGDDVPPLVTVTFRDIDEASDYTFDDLVLMVNELLNGDRKPSCLSGFDDMIKALNDELREYLVQAFTKELEHTLKSDNVVTMIRRKDKPVFYFK